MSTLPTIEIVENGAVIGGRLCPMTVQQRELFERLARGKGRLVSNESLITTLWPDPDREPDYAQPIVRQRVHQLRRLLRGYDLGIRNSFGAGYQIVPLGTAHYDTDFHQLSDLLGVPVPVVKRMLNAGQTSAGAVLARIKVRLGRAGGGA